MLETFRIEALNEHNRLRALHQTEPLVLDRKLCEVAQHKAERMAAEQRLFHSANGAVPYGENLAMYKHSSRDSYSGQEATSQWYRELSSYDYSNPRFTQQTGHFSQVSIY